MHTHSIYASALSVAGLAVPPMIDEMVIHIGGAVAVSEYAFPGTEELGEAVVRALGERTAALVRNHGLVGIGGNALEALAICQMVERAAQIYTVAESVGGANVSLITRVLIQRCRLALDPALSLVPAPRAPPKGCCPTTAPVGLSFT